MHGHTVIVLYLYKGSIRGFFQRLGFRVQGLGFGVVHKRKGC